MGRFLRQLGTRTAIGLLLAGCATAPVGEQPANSRPFDFRHDTLAYANELDWVYHFSASGISTSERQPKPAYVQHCFVMARSTRQFFQFARFDPRLPKLDDEGYRALIRDVVAHNPGEANKPADRVVIPGYADLRSFSEAKEDLLKDETGTRAGSYFQLGNWRMVFPFSRRHQQRTAAELLDEIRLNRPPVVHLVRFPKITINHAVILYAAEDTGAQVRFTAYDPNYPDDPQTLTYDRASRSFSLPANKYFAGGMVNVYEIYKGGLY